MITSENLVWLTREPNYLANNRRYRNFWDALSKLSDAGYHTIGCLLTATKRELLEVPGFGHKSLEFLVRELKAEYGFEIGQGLPDHVLGFTFTDWNGAVQQIAHPQSEHQEIRLEIFLNQGDRETGRLMELRIPRENFICTRSWPIVAFKGGKGYHVHVAYTSGRIQKHSESLGRSLWHNWGRGYLYIKNSWDIHRTPQ